MLLSVILSFIIDRETREEETYMSLLSCSLNHSSYNEGPSSLSPNYHSNGERGGGGGGGGYFISNNRNRPLSTYNQRRTSNSIPKYGSTPSTITTK